jgi:hypothetical protein
LGEVFPHGLPECDTQIRATFRAVKNREFSVRCLTKRFIDLYAANLCRV